MIFGLLPDPDEHKDLKPARSRAEITRVRQGYAIILINSITLSLVVYQLLTRG